MFDLIHGKKEVTLAQPVGNLVLHPDTNDKTPTRILFPLLCIANGPPTIQM